MGSFKPYYKWITFNIREVIFSAFIIISSFKPYYKWITFNIQVVAVGLGFMIVVLSFKPYYKWITFNIIIAFSHSFPFIIVLNLIINGLPSISITSKIINGQLGGKF